MQPLHSSPTGSSRTSPRRIDVAGHCRPSQATRLDPEHPPSSSRVVLAEGSEFVLEMPSRASPTRTRVSVKPRRGSAPHPSSAAASPSTSSTSSQLGSPPYRSYSAASSVTPPRSRQADRPYRPPPSSSARFYERQQQLWLLQQPSLLPPATSDSLATQSLPTPVSPTRGSSYQHPSHQLPHYTADPALSLHKPLASPLLSHAAKREHVSPPSRDKRDSTASSASRLRAASAGSLTVPDILAANRARSGSGASFTRSCVSPGYHSQTDEDSFDNDSYPAAFASESRPADSAFKIRHALQPLRPAARVDPADMASKPLQPGWSMPSRHHLDPIEALPVCNDDDWDRELGLSAAHHVGPLRLPQLPPAEQDFHSSPIASECPPAAEQPVAGKKLVVSAVANPGQTTTQLSSVQAADLKGIRVTSTVSESWDDDFLFQNEEDATESQHTHSGATCLDASRRGGATPPSASASMQTDDDNDEDVENWDDAFSWNVDQITPSASTRSSLQDAMRRTKTHGNDQPSMYLNRRSRDAHTHRRSDETGPSAETRKRISSSSFASDTTDFSARLAAQPDGGSTSQRASQDTTDLSAFDLVQNTRLSNVRISADCARRRRNTAENGNNDSGDDTETEMPAIETPALKKTRPARRSLGAALGLDSRRKPARSAENKRKDEVPADGISQRNSDIHSRPKLGALQRLSFSRSRVNVASTSTTDVSCLYGPNESPKQILNDTANCSQASLLSQMSGSSDRSRRGSLEKSYAALRSTSFRRLLGRAGQSGSSKGSAIGPESPSSPGSRPDLPQNMEAFRRPASEVASAHSPALSTSPPSAWLGFQRSSESTPKRNDSRSCQKASGNIQHASPATRTWMMPASPSTSPAASTDRSQLIHMPSSVSDARPSESRVGGGKLHINDVSSPLKGLRAMENPPSVGLRRDFSSSNTLRASLSRGVDAILTTTFDNPRTPAREDAFDGNSRSSSRDSHYRSYSGEATADGPTATGSLCIGEKTHRGLDGRGSTSRSVSASTAHSNNSSESTYGYRMRKQISVSSGADAHDSETSYGTSVGSSPGHSNWSSGWFSSGKRGAAAFADTGDDPMSSSVNILDHQGAPKQDHLVRNLSNTGVPGSPFDAEKTFESYSSRALLGPQMTLSPTRSTPTDPSGVSLAAKPSKASRPDGLGGTKLSPLNRTSSNAAQSTLIIPESSTASTHSRSSRRNSLSDLKIPSRISQAQTGIRNNITLVRDFAKGIEELKVLKANYMDHRTDGLGTDSDAEERIRNWLECADVLIGLGQGRSESDTAARVDTISHTPLAVRIDPRRPTVSDVSIYASPRSPLEDASLRQMASAGARSTSGTSQASASTSASHATSGGRSVDAQREIDILSAILGGARIGPAAARTEGRSHGRFLSETYSKDEHPQRRALLAVRTPVTEKRCAMSSAAAQEGDHHDEQRSSKMGATQEAERPYHTAPVLSSSSSGDAMPLDFVEVGDTNRSAKRRLRSASRAGLQGLRDLLKVFKSNAAVGDVTTTPPHAVAAANLSTAKDTPSDEKRFSIDTDGASRSSTSATKQKRRSLNLKRRSFLRSKTSLDHMKVGTSSDADVTPPVPTLTPDEKGGKASASKSPLDVTWEASSAHRDVRAANKAARRISLQCTGGNQRGSSEVVRWDSFPQSVESRCAEPLRPALQVRSATSSSAEGRRASTSNDHSQAEQPPPPPPPPPPPRPPLLPRAMMPKFALRPEAMPSLLVYVQATKEHLQAAIDELGPQVSLAKVDRG